MFQDIEGTVGNFSGDDRKLMTKWLQNGEVLAQKRLLTGSARSVIDGAANVVFIYLKKQLLSEEFYLKLICKLAITNSSVDEQ